MNKRTSIFLFLIPIILLTIDNVKGGRRESWQEMNWVYNNEAYFEKESNNFVADSGLKYSIIPRVDGNKKSRSKNSKLETGDKATVYYKLYISGGPRIHIYSQANENLPFSFEVGVVGVINTRGFDEAIRLMRVGDKGRFILPPNIAYGQAGQQAFKIPPNAELELYIEVLEVVKREALGGSSYYRPSTEHLYRKQGL
jgi:FKBP-type peptidyl-prolyl cis-trans isomerase